jgi:hypothetical protein
LQPALRTILLLAPVIFVAHFLEEGPGFVDWFNRHVARGITPQLFWTVNYTALVITAAVVAIEWVSARSASAAIVVAWFSFLMMANAILHVVASVADHAPMPGVFTAVLLYVPFYAWILTRIIRAGRLPPAAVVAIASIAALPMLLHGYLIVFRGSRLF